MIAATRFDGIRADAASPARDDDVPPSVRLRSLDAYGLEACFRERGDDVVGRARSIDVRRHSHPVHALLRKEADNHPAARREHATDLREAGVERAPEINGVDGAHLSGRRRFEGYRHDTALAKIPAAIRYRLCGRQDNNVWNIERGFDRGFCLNYSIALRAQRPPRDASRPSVEGERFQIEPWCVAFKLPFCTHIAASGDRLVGRIWTVGK